MSTASASSWDYARQTSQNEFRSLPELDDWQPGPAKVSSRPRAHAYHERVVRKLRHLHPLVGIAAKRAEAVEHSLEQRVGARDFGIELVRSRIAGLHHWLRKWTQLRSLHNQALDRLRIEGVVLGCHPDASLAGTRLHQGLVDLGELVPLGEI